MKKRLSTDRKNFVNIGDAYSYSLMALALYFVSKILLSFFNINDLASFIMRIIVLIICIFIMIFIFKKKKSEFWHWALFFTFILDFIVEILLFL